MTSFQLPLLQPHRQALEKCVYCPKLSRAACPVSNAAASETLTPWGKMSIAYFLARGDVPIDAEHALSAWACSSCYACRERCEHHNEVALVLNDARAELFARGAAPEAAQRACRRAAMRSAEYRQAVERLQGEARATDTALVIGCSYARHHPSVARDAVAVAERFAGGVRLCGSCCGLPSYYAGDRASFMAAGKRLAAELKGARRIIAVDPGCARALLSHQRELDLPEIVPLVDAVHRAIDRLPPLSHAGKVLRWADPCQLGRGLQRYDEPRAILARLSGEPPAGFVRERAQAECSGGGGLLPLTFPAESRAIADERIAEHRRGGGGLLVTGCAQSLKRYRSRGERAVDWIELCAAAFQPERAAR